MVYSLVLCDDLEYTSEHEESSKENQEPKKRRKRTAGRICYTCYFIGHLLTYVLLEDQVKSSAQIRNLAEAKVAAKESKMPKLPKHLATIAGIDLELLSHDRAGLKFDDESRKQIVFWMVENKCTEPSTAGKQLQLVELKKKLGFNTDGLPAAYQFLLEDKLKRDIGILKKQLISTHAIGYYQDTFKKGNKADPTYFFPFTSRWLLPPEHPSHIPLDLDLTWDPDIMKQTNNNRHVLQALASVTEILPKLSHLSQITLSTLIFSYPEVGFKGFPDPEDIDSDGEDLGGNKLINEGLVKSSNGGD